LQLFGKRQRALTEVAMDFPDVEFIVLSGHTHSNAYKQILPNLKSRV
jgi:hypothetical protein